MGVIIFFLPFAKGEVVRRTGGGSPSTSPFLTKTRLLLENSNPLLNGCSIDSPPIRAIITIEHSFYITQHVGVSLAPETGSRARA